MSLPHSTYININKRLSIGSRGSDVFFDKGIAMIIDVKDGSLLLIGRLIEIFGESLNRPVEGNVASIVATDNDLARQVGDKDGRCHHDDDDARVRVKFLDSS